MKRMRLLGFTTLLFLFSSALAAFPGQAQRQPPPRKPVPDFPEEATPPVPTLPVPPVPIILPLPLPPANPPEEEPPKKVPEPASVLGILTFGALGIGLQWQRQKNKRIRH